MGGSNPGSLDRESADITTQPWNYPVAWADGVLLINKSLKTVKPAEKLFTVFSGFEDQNRNRKRFYNGNRNQCGFEKSETAKAIFNIIFK